MFLSTVQILSLSIMTVLLCVGCGENNPSFSLLPEDDFFTQDNSSEVISKMDILWVIDNSGSMGTSQQQVKDNFNSFIQGFSANNFDYQLAVTTTDAYKAGVDFSDDPSRSRFRDGTDATSHTGVFIINPLTPDLIPTFMINVVQGTSGNSDERGMQSFIETLENPMNSGFVRDGSFLAVIIVSDEEDISRDGSGGYDPSDLHPVSDYVSYLDNLTNSSGANRRYSVNSMVIKDEVCRDFLNQSWNGRVIGTRYIELSNQTGGIVGDLCGDFAAELTQISDSIIQLATQFYLSRIPIPETIQISVDNVPVPNINENPGPLSGGWSYDADANSILFHGDYIPAQGAQIRVDYDPVNYGS